jgi:hypothetical protein
MLLGPTAGLESVEQSKISVPTWNRTPIVLDSYSGGTWFEYRPDTGYVEVFRGFPQPPSENFWDITSIKREAFL